MIPLIPLLLLAQEPAAPPATAKPADPALALVGKPAPDFTLLDQSDKPVALKDAKTAKKWVVLAFYPADMTAGCTLQNKSYTAGKDLFAPLNALVYTVSTQDTKSKRAFCQRDGLTNTLLSDTGGKVAAAYGVLNTERGVARRVTFYIDPKGQIAAVDTKINVKSAADDTVATLKKLQEGKELMPGPTPIDANGLKAVIAKNKGKTVVVNLWASWCVPCKQEFPDLMAAIKATGATLVTVACDTPQDAATKSAKFLTAQNATANAYFNKSGTDIAALLKWLEPTAPPTSPIPRTYIFAPSGKLVKAMAGKHDTATFTKEINAAKAVK